MAPDNALKAVFDLINKEALPKIGRPPASIARLRAYLEDAGFVDVKVVSVKHPYGPWAKDKRLKQIGAMCLLNMETAIEAYVMACAIKILGMQPEVATTMCQNALKAVRNKNNHMYSYLYVPSILPFHRRGLIGVF